MADKILNLSRNDIPKYMIGYGDEVVETGIIIDRQNEADPENYEKLVMKLIAEYGCQSAVTNRGWVLPI